VTWLGRYEELAWALALSAAAGWMFRWSVRRLRLALECHAWPRAEGIVMQSGAAYAGAAPSRLNVPRFLGVAVVYKFRVRGRLYTGSDVRFTAFYVAGHFRSLRRYPAGQKVRVLYHPDDPNVAALEAGATLDGWVEALAYGALFVAGVVWLLREAVSLAG
jgi:Protein of unknown function (DUF3592)